jgi:beta-lactamase class D
MKPGKLLALMSLAVCALPAAGAQSRIDCTVVADAASGKYLVHKGRCDRRVTPASTFKIAISLMGYDSGVLQDEHAPLLPFQQGYLDWLPAWRIPTDPSRWMQESVVWYSQQVAERVGQPRFAQYVRDFNYGNQDVFGKPAGLDGFPPSWINSTLAISPDEQVAFLRKIVMHELALRDDAYRMTARIIKFATTANGWDIYGKTGTGSPVLRKGGSDRAYAYGWFVGWATKGERTIVFARLVQDRKEQTVRAGLRVRDGFLRDLPAQLERL